jgi:ATP:corrinoid adenosyltransferase
VRPLSESEREEPDMDAEKSAKYLSTYRKSIEASTGKTLAQIHAALKKSGAGTHTEMVNFLKSDLKLGHGHANFVVHTMKNAEFGARAEQAAATDTRPAKKAPAKKTPPKKAAAKKPAKKK